MATTKQQKGTGNENTTATPSTEDTMSDVKASAGQAFDQAKEKVTEAANQAQQKAKSQLAERKDQVADGIDTVVAALRKTGEDLEGQNTGPVGGYVSKAANALGNISQHVRQNDVDQLLHEVEGFARREPAIALGSAFAIGVIAARFLKSSNQRRSNTSGQYDSMGNQYASASYTSTPYTSNQNRNSNGPYSNNNYANNSRYSDGSYADGNMDSQTTNSFNEGSGTSGTAEES